MNDEDSKKPGDDESKCGSRVKRRTTLTQSSERMNQSDTFIVWLQGFMDAVPNLDFMTSEQFLMLEDRIREENDRITR